VKRAKYKCKNINAFKRIFECDVPGCKDHGIVVYRNDTETQPVRHERRCIDHVHWTKEPTAIDEAKNPYATMTDVSKWLSFKTLHTGGC
jgi:hypothetical protein